MSEKYIKYDIISRAEALQAIMSQEVVDKSVAKRILMQIPSAEPERKKVIPHRNYQYLSDYWCECGNHLGKKYEVTYCSNCGRKVDWDE